MRQCFDDIIKVARIAFTGGTSSARHIIRISDEFLRRIFELGGKSPFIVFDDANIESRKWRSGRHFCCLWPCVAGSRLYLHEDIADDFLARMVKIAKGIKIGDPRSATEMGPLCTNAQMSLIKEQVALATEQGGTVLTGGNAREDLGGLYLSQLS